MELLQSIDFTNPIWLTLGCVLLCILGLVGTFVLQIIGIGMSIFIGIFELIVGVFELGIGAITAGPIGCLGCFLATLLFGSCAALTLALVWALPRCGTSEAVNLCRLLGA